MKTTFLIMLPIFALILIGFSRLGTISPEENADGLGEASPSTERGAYLVNIMACNDCHTPFKMGPQGPEPDMSRMLSGHPAELKMPPPPQLGMEGWAWAGAASNTAYAGPWGISYAANLTPANTGLKGWNEDMFVSALKTGWHMGVENSRRIQPPMPWPAYSQATDEDLRSIFAYLQSIPPVENIPPAYQPQVSQ